MWWWSSWDWTFLAGSARVSMNWKPWLVRCCMVFKILPFDTYFSNPPSPYGYVDTITGTTSA